MNQGAESSISYFLLDFHFLESITNNFQIKYKDVLENFNGEVSHFKSFSSIIPEILNTQFKDFKKFLSIEHQLLD